MAFLRNLPVAVAGYGRAGYTWALGPSRASAAEQCIVNQFRYYAATHPWLLALSLTWGAFVSVPVSLFAGYVFFWVTAALAFFLGVVFFWAALGLVLLVPAVVVASGLAAVTFVSGASTILTVVWVSKLFGVDVAEWWRGEGTNQTVATTKMTPKATKTSMLKATTNGNTGNTQAKGNPSTEYGHLSDDAIPISAVPAGTAVTTTATKPSVTLPRRPVVLSPLGAEKKTMLPAPADKMPMLSPPSSPSVIHGNGTDQF